jgi:hypothetical protein
MTASDKYFANLKRHVLRRTTFPNLGRECSGERPSCNVISLLRSNNRNVTTEETSSTNGIRVVAAVWPCTLLLRLPK